MYISLLEEMRFFFNTKPIRTEKSKIFPTELIQLRDLIKSVSTLIEINYLRSHLNSYCYLLDNIYWRSQRRSVMFIWSYARNGFPAGKYIYGCLTPVEVRSFHWNVLGEKLRAKVHLLAVIDEEQRTACWTTSNFRDSLQVKSKRTEDPNKVTCHLCKKTNNYKQLRWWNNGIPYQRN